MRNRTARQNRRMNRRNQIDNINNILENNNFNNIMDNLGNEAEREDFSSEESSGDVEVMTITRRPPPRPNSVNITVLAAVLGSVVVVCIAAIVIVWLIRRERRNRSNGSTNSSEDVVKFQRSNWNRASGQYETVGPALPNRPAAKHQPDSYIPMPTSNLNTEATETTTNSNGVYVDPNMQNLAYVNQVNSKESEPTKVRNLAEDEDAYLRPVMNRSDEGFVDENNYLNLTYTGETEPEMPPLTSVVRQKNK